MHDRLQGIHNLDGKPTDSRYKTRLYLNRQKLNTKNDFGYYGNS